MLAPYELINELTRFKKGMDSLLTGYQKEDYYYQEFPPVNIVEGDDHIKIYALISGVDPNDLDITLENGVFTLRGERKNDCDDNKKYIRQERAFGKFMRQFKLKVPVDGDKVEAHYKNGVLEATLTKAPEAKPIKINVH